MSIRYQPSWSRAQTQAQEALAAEPGLIAKIEKATAMPGEAEALLTEVFCFLQLLAAREEGGPRLVPSHWVDMAWHELILFTRYYAACCEAHFGRFMHHYPGGHEEENRAGFKQTHYRYEKSFGQAPNPRYWGWVIAPIADAGDCGL